MGTLDHTALARPPDPPGGNRIVCIPADMSEASRRLPLP